jgi:hypothetical protein
MRGFGRIWLRWGLISSRLIDPGGKAMNTAMIEKAIVQELHDMPLEAAQEVLDFTLFIKQRRRSASDVPLPRPNRRVGLLAGEGVELHDFEMSDEELLGS